MLLTVATSFKYTDITYSANVQQIATANPMRWGIGFIPIGIVPDTIAVAPWSDFDVSRGIASSTPNPQWFKIFDYGSIVTATWYISGTAGNTVRVVELLRSQMGR